MVKNVDQCFINPMMLSSDVVLCKYFGGWQAIIFTVAARLTTQGRKCFFKSTWDRWASGSPQLLQLFRRMPFCCKAPEMFFELQNISSAWSKHVVYLWNLHRGSSNKMVMMGRHLHIKSLTSGEHCPTETKWEHQTLTSSRPALRLPGTLSVLQVWSLICFYKSLKQCGHNGFWFLVAWPTWVPFVHFLCLWPDISQEQP